MCRKSIQFCALLVSAGLMLAPAALAGKGGSGGGGKGGKGGGGGGGGGSTGSATYGGHAVVVNASILGIQTILTQAGPLGTTGGAAEASLLTTSVLGLVNAEVLHAATVGQDGYTHSEASAAGLSLSVANTVSVSAGFIESYAAATCGSASGSSDIVALAINGKSIRVSGKPNQEVNLLLAKVVINEQIVTPGGIIVNALHVTVLDILGHPVADVVVSSAEADIMCQGAPACSGGDFVTGGGWITGTPSGAKANFGVAGGLKNGSLWGHLTYIDHGNGLKVTYHSITGYTVVNSTVRLIEGTADANGEDVTFTVIVADNGEPGTNDTFQIQLSNGYSATGTLGGGNIQLHGQQGCQ
jgi:hypothetical protein